MVYSYVGLKTLIRTHFLSSERTYLWARPYLGGSLEIKTLPPKLFSSRGLSCEDRLVPRKREFPKLSMIRDAFIVIDRAEPIVIYDIAKLLLCVCVLCTILLLPWFRFPTFCHLLACGISRWYCVIYIFDHSSSYPRRLKLKLILVGENTAARIF